MPLKLNVGVSRKLGQPDYGSLGASCHIEVELPQELLERDLEGFHVRVRDAYIAAHQAVHDELDRLQGQARSPRPLGGPNGHAGCPGDTAPRPRSETPIRSNGRPRKSATARQLAAIEALARRGGADLDALLAELGVERPEALSLAQASALIDTLKAAEAL
jgi:hypothetical protein